MNRFATKSALALVGLALIGSASLARSPKDISKIERGRYLVNGSGCHDCHTPWTMGPQGPQPDMQRMLIGHPAELDLSPPPDLGDGPWVMAASDTNTAWAGPWGISFTANLTPDEGTGTGLWSEEEFIATLRTGRHLGRGRELLPPMPWPAYGQLSDEDLGAIFAYLQSLPPVHNPVPSPRPPAAR